MSDKCENPKCENPAFFRITYMYGMRVDVCADCERTLRVDAPVQGFPGEYRFPSWTLIP